MSTEARIGIVAGLLIVVVASVYFVYGHDSKDTDVLVSADPKVAPPPKIPASTDAKNKPTPTPAGKPSPAAPRPVSPAPAASKPPSPTLTPGASPQAGPAAPSPRSMPGSPLNPGAVGTSATPPVRPDHADASPKPAVAPGVPPQGSGTGETKPTPERLAANPPTGKPTTPAPPSAFGPPAPAATPAGPTTQPTGVKSWPRRTTSAPAGGAVDRPYSPPLRSGPSTELVDATRDNLSKPAEPTTGEEKKEEKPADGGSSPTIAGSSSETDRPAAAGPRTGGSAVTPPKTGGVPTKPPAAKPATLTPTPTPPAETWPKKHQIAQGDTLSSLADRYYGSSTPEKIAHLLKANPRIKDPRSMKIGDTVAIPAWDKPATDAASKTTSEPPKPGGTSPDTTKSAPSGASGDAAKTPGKPAGSSSGAPAAPPPDSGKAYRVNEGESFYSIARAQLGSGARWEELFRLNKDLVKGDPKRLKAGMTIKLPS